MSRQRGRRGERDGIGDVSRSIAGVMMRDDIICSKELKTNPSIKETSHEERQFIAMNPNGPEHYQKNETEIMDAKCLDVAIQ